jgi:hypothetical protein
VRATFAFAQQLARFLEVLDISALPKVLDDLVHTIRSQLLQSDILSTHAERLSPVRVFGWTGTCVPTHVKRCKR